MEDNFIYFQKWNKTKKIKNGRQLNLEQMKDAQIITNHEKENSCEMLEFIYKKQRWDRSRSSLVQCGRSSRIV